MFSKYGIITNLDQRVSLEFIDSKKTSVKHDDESESQITER